MTYLRIHFHKHHVDEFFIIIIITITTKLFYYLGELHEKLCQQTWEYNHLRAQRVTASNDQSSVTFNFFLHMKLKKETFIATK